MKRLPRRLAASTLLPIAGAALLLVTLLFSGCTAIKRTAIRGQLRGAFIQPPGADLTRVAPSVYSYRWLGYRTMFVTTPEGVVVFDPLNEDAARGLSAEIAKVAPNPEIKIVVYSHFHRDHASGASALPGHPAILAHANAVRELTARGLPEVARPTEVFADEVRDLSLGGTTIRLMHLPYSHTDGLLMAYLPKERVLFEVDIIWLHQLPPPGVPDMSFAGVRRATEMMLALDFDTLVPAHGPIGTKADVVRYHDFLADLEGAFRASMTARGMTNLAEKTTFLRAQDELSDVFFDVEDALRPKYGGWENFDALILTTSVWCLWHVLTGT
ncbi:Metallo-beta-lactamase family protein [Minicystis rosea]|nr:Metallo-beta-lactamase family protein [Minicystis rosea]